MIVNYKNILDTNTLRFDLSESKDWKFIINTKINMYGHIC